MKKQLLLLLMLLVFTAQAQKPDWYREDFLPTGSTTNDSSALTIDDNGNVYVAYRLANSLKLYVAKLDTDGNVLWNDIIDGSEASFVAGAEIINNGGTDYLYLGVDTQTTTTGMYQTLGLICYNISTGAMEWFYEYEETNVGHTSQNFSVGADGTLMLTAEDLILFLDKDGNMLSQQATTINLIKKDSSSENTTSPDADADGKFTNNETAMPFSVGSPLANTPTPTDVYNAEISFTRGVTYFENDPSHIDGTIGVLSSDTADPVAGLSDASPDSNKNRTAILNADGLYRYGTCNDSNGDPQQVFTKFNKTDKTTVEWTYNWKQDNGNDGMILSDENGNIYLISWDSLYYLNSSGGIDILIHKFDKNGNLLWNKVYGNGTGAGNEVTWMNATADIDTTNKRIALNTYTDSFNSSPKAALLILNYDGELQNYTIVGDNAGNSFTGGCAKFDSNGDVFGTGLSTDGSSSARLFKIDPTTVFNCPDGFTCNVVEETICSSETYTTPEGYVISGTESYEETVGTVITTYDVTLDTGVDCCPDGVTCTSNSGIICTDGSYDTPNGTEYTTAGTFQEVIDASNRVNWTITLDEAITCCPQGFTCDEETYNDTKPLTTSDDVFYTASGQHKETDGTNQTIHTVTITTNEGTQDLVADATLSDAMDFTAKTNYTAYLDFDKTSERYVNLDVLQDDLNGTDRSVFMWIKKHTNVSSSSQVLFGINTSTGGNVCNLQISTGEYLQVFDGSNSKGNSITIDNNWHHVGYTYNTTTNETKIYLDGVVKRTFTNNQATVSNSTYSLGQEYDSGLSTGNYFDGYMSEVSIWNTVLDTDDISSLMNGKVTNTHPSYANLKGYYSFMENNQSTAVLKDWSGNTNNGTVVGDVLDSDNNYENIINASEEIEFNATNWYDVAWLRDDAFESDTQTTTIDNLGDYKLYLYRDYISILEEFTIDGTLNVNVFTTKDNDGLNIFIDSSTEKLNITGGKSNQVKKIQIYNFSGDMVYYGVEKNIDVSNFQSGVYLLRLQLDNSFITAKFVKQ